MCECTVYMVFVDVIYLGLKIKNLLINVHTMIMQVTFIHVQLSNSYVGKLITD